MISDKEKKVLVELSKNPRASYRNLARKAGVAPATFIQRIKGLEKKGIITGYKAMVDVEKLGYTITAVIEVQAKRSGFFKAEASISKLSNICAIYDVTGPYDFVIIARFRDKDEVSRFVRELLAMEFIERANTRLVLSTLKEDFHSLTGRV